MRRHTLYENTLDLLVSDLLGSHADELNADFFTSTRGPCPKPNFLPGPGDCYRPGGSGDLVCEKGIWYRPKFGDNLSSIARRTLKQSGIKDISSSEYKRQISSHPSNYIFHSKSGSGLATRQFLPRWGGPLLRTEVGVGGKYGLMFLPAPSIDIGASPSGGRFVITKKVSCPRR